MGSGFSDWELRRIKDIFDSSPRVAHPFDIGEPWVPVATNLRAEVKYYKVTDSGVLRFPVFLRLV